RAGRTVSTLSRSRVRARFAVSGGEEIRQRANGAEGAVPCPNRSLTGGPPLLCAAGLAGLRLPDGVGAGVCAAVRNYSPRSHHAIHIAERRKAGHSGCRSRLAVAGLP